MKNHTTLSIRKRPNGLLEGRFYVNAKRKSVFGREPREVELKYAKALLEEKPEPEPETEAESPAGRVKVKTLGGLFKRWHGDGYIGPRSESISANTKALRDRGRGRIVAAFGADAPLRSITADRIDHVFETQFAAYGSRSRQQDFETLRAALNYARRTLRVISDNPALIANRPKHGSREVEPITRKQAFALIDAAADTQERTLLQLLFATGMRISEALGLAVEDYDRETGILEVRAQLERRGNAVRVGDKLIRSNGAEKRIEALKSSASRRRIMLDRVTRKLFETHLASATTGYVFRQTCAHAAHTRGPCSTIGKPFTYDGRARDILADAAAKAGVPDMTWHRLRHTASTTMRELGVDPFVAERILGHRVPGIQARYLKVTDKMLEDYAKIMGDFFCLLGYGENRGTEKARR